MSARDEAAGGVAAVEPPAMPPNARTELWAIAERLRWLANEPDADAGMASTVTWQVKLEDARFLDAVSAALVSPSPRDQASSAMLGALAAAQDHVGVVRLERGFDVRVIQERVSAAIALARSAGIETERNG